MIFNYNKIFCGLILIVLDFNLSLSGTTLDILPDFIGYFMIASFFKHIPNGDYNKHIGALFADILGVYNILLIFLPPLNGNATLISLNLIISTIISAINLGVNYFICKIIIEEARKYRKEHLLSFGYKTWYLVVSYSIFYMIISPFFINYSFEGLFLATPLLILGFLEIIFLIVLTYKAKNILPTTDVVVE